MPVIHIDDIDDPRLEKYRNVRDKDMRQRYSRFLTEGKRVTLRLFRCGFQAESVLTTPKRLPQIQDEIPPDIPIYLVDEQLMIQTAGFAVHTGILAVGIPPDPISIDELVERLSGKKGPLTFFVGESFKEAVNLGAVIRTSAAAGIDAIILGEHCVDAFSRRGLRSAMGAAFRIPIVKSTDLAADLHILQSKHNFKLHATVISDRAIPLDHVERSADYNDRIAILLGHEVSGLSDTLIDLADEHITIPIRDNIDSLNVNAAAALCAYHYCYICGKSPA